MVLIAIDDPNMENDCAGCVGFNGHLCGELPCCVVEEDGAFVTRIWVKDNNETTTTNS